MVSIAGAILWGVLRDRAQANSPSYIQFQSQGRFFGGCCDGNKAQVSQEMAVSIAGAILWGVLPQSEEELAEWLESFNRRGDSLGGAAKIVFLCHGKV